MPLDPNVLALTPDEIARFLRSHGLPAEAPQRFAWEGVVNCVWMTDDLVVRVLKEPDYASDVYTETVAVPAARAAGVLTPELLLFDDTRSMIDSVVSVYRRVPGDPLAHSTAPQDEVAFYRELGRQIAYLHGRVRHVPDPNGYLDRPERDDPRSSLERQAHHLTPAARHWVEHALARLDGIAAMPLPDVFVHWDLNPYNLMVHEGRLAALLDWGDAGWGHPAITYRYLPARYLPELLEGVDDPDDVLAAAIVHQMIGYALNAVHEPVPAERPYHHYGIARWDGLRILAGRPGPWQPLLAGIPPATASGPNP